MIGAKSFVDTLESIRQAEIAAASTLLPANGRVLEIGGGDGYQAHLLSEAGFDVASIDVADRVRRGTLHFPVQDYDGRSFPFPSQSFDAVFSSNVLEHVADLTQMFSEMRRVMKPQARAVHLLPTPAWRAWTTVVHYPWVAASMPARFRRRSDATRGEFGSPPPTSGSRLLRWMGLNPHGEYPNALFELYYFSKRRWRREFQDNGFTIVSEESGGLFYTGQLLVPQLTVPTRRRFAKFLGAACRVFVLSAAHGPAPAR